MLPHQSSQPPIGPHLVSANVAAIPAWGVQPTSVQFGNNVYRFWFVLAAVPFPILGADFLAHHRLLVDPHHHRVLRSADLQPLSASSTSAPPSSPFVLQTMPLPIQDMVAE